VANAGLDRVVEYLVRLIGDLGRPGLRVVVASMPEGF